MELRKEIDGFVLKNIDQAIKKERENHQEADILLRSIKENLGGK